MPGQSPGRNLAGIPPKPPRHQEEQVFANSEELLRYVKDEGVKFVDVRFCDLPGIMQHFNVPVESFDESVFRDGSG